MLAIHQRKGSFSDKWVEYCETHDIQYKIVNCYSSDIVNSLHGCDALMWHWGHNDHKAVLFARQLTYSLELSGIKVFPDSNTVWHFDDKVGQKYLLESIGAPLIPSHVFYDKYEAMEWIKAVSFPMVFKLRGGAGAENVRIARTEEEAKRLIKRAFGRGFSVKNRLNFLSERVWQYKRDQSLKSFFNISKGLARLIVPDKSEKNFPSERNYVYFQDFIPDNDCDIRIIVIGKRAFAIKRMVRDDDFRASGSGNIIYKPEEIPTECLKLSFEVTRQLGAQCVAFDYVFQKGQPLIVEISYSFARKGYLDCPGYWTNQLEWVNGQFYPEYFMIEDFLTKRNTKVETQDTHETSLETPGHRDL